MRQLVILKKLDDDDDDSKYTLNPAKPATLDNDTTLHDSVAQWLASWLDIQEVISRMLCPHAPGNSWGLAVRTPAGTFRHAG